MERMDRIKEKISKLRGQEFKQDRTALIIEAIADVIDKQDDILKKATVNVNHKNDVTRRDWDAAMTGINTILIQETGRFVESYASDLLISIDTMRDSILNMATLYNEAKEDYPNTDNIAQKGIFLFGLRENGVDHLEYVVSRMDQNLASTQSFEDYYRRIYAVTAEITDPEPGNRFSRGEFRIELKDIRRELSHALWKIGYR